MGIFIINEDKKKKNWGDKILGFPKVNSYKYLGIKLNAKTDVKPHITAINTKLNEYLKRNQTLQRVYFTPMTLVRICDYFVKSRLSYGLCCFLDCTSSVKLVENSLAKT